MPRFPSREDLEQMRPGHPKRRKPMRKVPRAKRRCPNATCVGSSGKKEQGATATLAFTATMAI